MLLYSRCCNWLSEESNLCIWCCIQRQMLKLQCHFASICSVLTLFHTSAFAIAPIQDSIIPISAFLLQMACGFCPHPCHSWCWSVDPSSSPSLSTFFKLRWMSVNIHRTLDSLSLLTKACSYYSDFIACWHVAALCYLCRLQWLAL